MQNQSTKINHNNKAFIQDSKISRIHTEKSSKPINNSPHSEYNDKKHHGEKDIHLVKEKHAQRKKIREPHNSNSRISSLIKRVMDFLKSDDALLILVFLLLIQDDTEDEILFGLLIYLFLSDKI